MLTLDFGSLFLLGLLGTGHCVGMCGPIVLALPTGGRPLLGQLAYHAGRLGTYVAIGALLGALGSGLGWITRAQIGLSLVAALFLLWFGLTRLGVLREPALLRSASLAHLPGFQRLSRRLLSRRGYLRLTGFGLLMGFLPCGLSFAAFARALPAGPSGAALLVLAFGAGTLPGLLLVGTAASGLMRRHAKLTDLLAGVVMVMMGISLAVDGLGALL